MRVGGLGRGQELFELMRSNDSRELSQSVSPRTRRIARADRTIAVIAISAAFFERAAELPEHRDSGRAEGVIADPRGDPRRSRALVVDAARAYWA